MGSRIRVGAVNYLNAKPLVEGLTDFSSDVELSFDLPSRLADRMAKGEFDVGLIPVVEYARGKNYSYIPGIGICSRGPVLSVTLFSRVPWEKIRTLSLDEGSRSSAALTRILLHQKFGLRPQLQPLPIDAEADDLKSDAVLLIGDRAMRACLPGYDYAYDLGQEWTEWSGLPMVYAVWAVRPGIELGDTAKAFVRARDLGMARAGAIAAREAPGLNLDAGYARRYLTNIIHYTLGPDDMAGFNRYLSLAAELGLAPAGGRREHRHDLVESY